MAVFNEYERALLNAEVSKRSSGYVCDECLSICSRHLDIEEEQSSTRLI